MSESSEAKPGSAAVDKTEKKSKATATVQAQPVNRSVADIEADMEATRKRLSATLDDLKVATKPANLFRKQVDNVKAFYVDDYGGLRVERVAATVGVVVALVVVRRTWRRITD